MAAGPEIIFRYFPELNETQKAQFRQLAVLYNYWNARINVISRKDMDNFYLHHVLHSLSIAKTVQFKSFTTVMDAGTGGGFPGIPLAILYPETSFHLVDSIGKKIKVVKEVSTELGLNNVEAVQLRMDEVGRSFDFIVSRAVTYLPDFVKWVRYNFHQQSLNTIPNGILYLKGGDLKAELQAVKKLQKKLYSLDNYFDETFFETKKLVHLYK
ncbi:MAG: 16S rRNA (guanine(527)-N(7))-methyltransferase RsmG [Bacteroidales bacterium]|nr:16S rRNA (guanine(527)-N(7))-methyltransferase RsmG [Bacteroidales bacterium]MCF6341885.1 16S rRNA (guanine(527)-N(7))-methyltransferase RsmG [Bacteroidales bacterium]